MLRDAAVLTHQTQLINLSMDAMARRDSALGAGNHSAVYALRWRTPRSSADAAAAEADVEELAVAKVAAQNDAQLAEEAAVLGELADARCASLPRLLYTSRSSFQGVVEDDALEAEMAARDAEARGLPAPAPPSPRALQPAFLVMTPIGTPLPHVLARLARDADAAAAAADDIAVAAVRSVRAALAERVAHGLLDALRCAHERGFAHGNIKFPNIVLAPPLPLLGKSNGRPPLTLDDVASRTAVLVDWGTAQRMGARKPVRSQGGLAMDAVETLMAEAVAAELAEEDMMATYGFTAPEGAGLSWWYSRRRVPRRVPRLTVLPRWDLEAVAYAYAALRKDTRSAAALSCYQYADESDLATIPPWHPRAARRSVYDDEEATAPRRGDAALEALAAAETGLAWLGPRAWRRFVWLHEHPDALGERGRRFLAHVRAGRAVYTLDLDDADVAGAPLRVQAAPWDDHEGVKEE